MARNGIKLLTSKQLKDFNEKYISTMVNDFKFIKIDNRNYKRYTLHDSSKSFRINSNIRNIVITTEMMNIFREFILDNYSKIKDVSIFDIMQAVNILYLTYQDITYKNVKRILLGDIKIKQLNGGTQNGTEKN